MWCEMSSDKPLSFIFFFREKLATFDPPFEVLFSLQVEQLKDDELARLAPMISYQSMQSIALQRLGFTDAEISSLVAECRENTEKFNRQILLKWRNKNHEGSRQVLFLCCGNIIL